MKIYPEGLVFSKGIHAAQNYSFQFIADDRWQYAENTGYKNHLFIIGGGH
ncbi:MAG: hypothetical protein ABI472_21185 [Ginsengibacter sp.]